MSDAVFYTDGEFSQQAWIDYWRALWSAPSQPGYATVIREGIASLTMLAGSLRPLAESVGNDEARKEIEAAVDQLRTYGAIAAATNDAAILQSNVADLMLASPNSPIFELGRATLQLLKHRPQRSWSRIFREEVAQPMARAAKVAAVQTGLSLGRIALVAGLVVGAWWIFREERAQ